MKDSKKSNTYRVYEISDYFMKLWYKNKKDKKHLHIYLQGVILTSHYKLNY